jgi:hypothetical protein
MSAEGRVMVAAPLMARNPSILDERDSGVLLVSNLARQIRSGDQR